MQIQNVLMMTDFGGRIDQTISQIQTLFKWPLSGTVNVYLRSHDTLAWLLWPGQHEINVSQELATNENWCSYIPMNGCCCVTTTGLKYDLSTSNLSKFAITIHSTHILSRNFHLQQITRWDLVN